MAGAVLRLGGSHVGGYGEPDIAYAYRHLSRALHPDKNPTVEDATSLLQVLFVIGLWRLRLLVLCWFLAPSAIVRERFVFQSLLNSEFEGGGHRCVLELFCCM